MTVAEAIAKRATCPRASVGAVLVDAQNRIIGTGYNGSPTGLAHCTDKGCIKDYAGHCVRTIHAEANALANAVASPRGATLYVTHFPCIRCANLLIQAGVKRVVYLNIYGSTELSLRLLTEAGVRVGPWVPE